MGTQFQSVKQPPNLGPKMLWYEVLRQTIKDLTSEYPQSRVRDEALYWITREQDGHFVFEFESVCDVLGFNPIQVVRSIIARMNCSESPHKKTRMELICWLEKRERKSIN